MKEKMINVKCDYLFCLLLCLFTYLITTFSFIPCVHKIIIFVRLEKWINASASQPQQKYSSFAFSLFFAWKRRRTSTPFHDCEPLKRGYLWQWGKKLTSDVPQGHACMHTAPWAFFYCHNSCHHRLIKPPPNRPCRRRGWDLCVYAQK